MKNSGRNGETGEAADKASALKEKEKAGDRKKEEEQAEKEQKTEKQRVGSPTPSSAITSRNESSRGGEKKDSQQGKNEKQEVKKTEKKDKKSEPADWNWLFYLLLAAGVLLFLGLIIYFAFRYYSKYSKKEMLVVPTSAIFSGVDITSLDESCYDKALRLKKQGDFAGAIRWLFIGTLLHLDRSGLISIRETWTNREYMHALRNNRHIYKNFSNLNAIFERHIYGFRPGDRAVFEEATKNYIAITGGRGSSLDGPVREEGEER